MKRADLHIHSTSSDGSFTAEELLILASKHNINCISITDHDSIGSLEAALNLSPKYNIEFIPGIEFGTDLNDLEELHILGYYIDYKNTRLLEELEKIKLYRYQRAIKIIERLNKLGLKIDIEEIKEVANLKESIGRPHIAEVLYKKGFVNSIKEAFERFIGKNCYAYVPRYKLKPEQIIELIKISKGISVIAHPGTLKEIKILDYLRDIGINGIEVYHYKHDLKQIEYFKNYAEKHGMLITGGTDFHGLKSDNIPFGLITIEYDYVLKLKDYLKKYM